MTRLLPPFASEPASPLKQAAQILWDYVHLHGLQMDGCGVRCADDAIRNVEHLYEKKGPSVTEEFPEPIPEPEFMPMPVRPGQIKPTPARADIDE